MHLSHKKGGRGLVQLKISLKTSIIEIDTNLNNTNDWILKLVKNRKINACTLLLAMPKNILLRLTLGLTTFLKIVHLLKKQNKFTHRQKPKKNNELKEGWKDKPLHGKYLLRASDPEVNFSLTHKWLASSGLKSEPKGFIIAAQEQSLPTRNFQANILENGADPKMQSL